MVSSVSSISIVRIVTASVISIVSCIRIISVDIDGGVNVSSIGSVSVWPIDPFCLILRTA